MICRTLKFIHLPCISLTSVFFYKSGCLLATRDLNKRTVSDSTGLAKANFGGVTLVPPSCENLPCVRVLCEIYEFGASKVEVFKVSL
jgi:hypothetical protein